MMEISIYDKERNKSLTVEEVALYFHNQGHKITYGDIECVAKDLEEDQYYILDESGNYVWLDPDKFEVINEEI